MQKLLTIIISTYNRPKLLKRLLKSIFICNLNDKLQINVINDNSSISYEKEIEEFYKYKNFYYKKNYENSYKIKNILSFVGKINSEFVLIADDKDYFLENGICKIIKFLEKNIGKLCISYHLNKKNKCLGKKIKNNNSLWKHMYELGFISDRFIYIPSFFFNRIKINNEQFKDQKIYGEFLIYENVLYQPTFSLEEPISVHEYQKNGVTENLLKLKTENWKYTLYCVNYILNRNPSIKIALKELVELYNINKNINLKKKLNFKKKYIILFFFLKEIGFFKILNFLYKKAIKKLYR